MDVIEMASATPSLLPVGDADAVLRRERDWIFLPRPWLEVDVRDVVEGEALDGGGDEPQCEHLHRTGATLYVKGTIARRGRETIRLAYWHRVATI
jgi:hypothetical protein